MPGFDVGEHHVEICEALERVERGEIDRLMIEAPPRHGKTELVSRRFPAWLLGRNNNKQIITATYGKDLSTDIGRDVRDIITSEEYGRVFPGTHLRKDVQAAHKWRTDTGGIYNATAVRSATTGLGSHVALIDDPHKDREEADSEIYREKVWRWYTSTLYTRLMPGGAIILIMTRWHEDDLAGRLLGQKDGDSWVRIKLPAIAQEHTNNEQALWPSRFPLPTLRRIRKQLTAGQSRDWFALYQQEPTQEQGDYFRREWFHWFKDNPKDLHLYGASDYAVTDGGGDFSEHGVFGLNPLNDVYILDWWFGQTSSDVWIDTKLDMVAKHKPLAWFGEGGVIQKAVQPMLTMRGRERKIYFRMEWLASIHDKAIRARSFQAMAASGRVWLPDNPMGHRLVEQLIKFPAGKYDDAVDVCSLFGRALDQTHPAIVKREPANGPPDRWRDLSKSRRNGAETWRTV